MAPIYQTSDGSAAYTNLLESWAATICLMVGMIISLLGIKIWWFKHRLNFEQHAAPKDDTRGGQPVLRNNVKDKKQLQQVSDSVVVHGIFRKRNEDELEVFERPRQLPPVRIPERLMNATALMPPPRAKRGNSTPKISVPVQEASTSDPHSLQDESMMVENIYLEPLELKSQLSSANSKEQQNEEAVEDGTIGESSATEPERLFQKVKQAAVQKNFEKLSTQRRATGILSPAELLYQSSEELDAPKDSKETVELFFKDLESIEDDSKWKTDTIEENQSENFIQSSSSDNAGFTSSILNEPNESIETVEAEREVQQIEAHFWELESHEGNDNEFERHIQQEFEKRRHSYQEHEGHFLELSEPLNQAQSPTGYGKSIDEDWENFQDLKTTKFEEIEVDPHVYRVKGETAYVQSIEELYDELTDNDDDDDEPGNNIVITQSVSPTQKSSILKERIRDFTNSGYEASFQRAHKLKAQQKVTFDVHTEEYYLPESETEESEYEYEEESNNYEHYIKHKDEEYKNAAPPLPKRDIPTPMQRKTKIQYNIDNVETIETHEDWKEHKVQDNQQQQQHAAALLFSTQISVDSAEATDGFDTSTDSWETMRQRRYQSNEVEETSLFKPMPRGSPRPAHRTTATQPRRSSTEA